MKTWNTTAEMAETTLDRGTGRARRLGEAVDRLEQASPLLRDDARRQVQQAARAVLGLEDGPTIVLGLVPRMEEAGLFIGTPWQDPTRLQPRLVAGGMLGEHPYPTMEVLNLLRMLARATTGQPGSTAQRDAAEFLERVVALNLDFLFPRDTEATRNRDPEQTRRAAAVFELIIDRLPQHDLVRLVAEEIEAICHQRPVWTEPVRRMVHLCSRIPGASESGDTRVDLYVEAILGPSPMSRRFREPAAYRSALGDVDDAALAIEVQDMAQSLRTTGLACSQHAVLLRHLTKHRPDMLADALGLSERGRSELVNHQSAVHDLLLACIHPATCQAAYGLARLLERGLMERHDVAEGLRRVAQVRLHPNVAKRLNERRSRGGVDANAWLLSGAVRVLGQPLGVGQGRNPTCQAARGLSLWSQHRPGYLMEVLTRAAEEDDVAVYFGDQELHSKDLTGGLAGNVDPELDPVSLVLVPHLDRLYDEMMRRVAHLGGDGHRWVNPGLYGRIVPNGFFTCFEAVTWRIVDHQGFLRAFFATHHPDYRSRDLLYPNPVGILVTSAHAELLGLHAITIQRAEPDPQGEVRVYFYNPNDESRQDWGQGVRPSVHGHGELEGESSLPFDHFASRIYGFHQDPFAAGDGYAVPDDRVTAISHMARESWGRSYTWSEPA